MDTTCYELTFVRLFASFDGSVSLLEVFSDHADEPLGEKASLEA